MKWYLHACPVCHGDIHEDVEERGWVTCFMCGRSYPQREILAQQLHVVPSPVAELPKAA